MQLACCGVSADASGYTVPHTITKLEEISTIWKSICYASREELITSAITY